MIAASRVGVGIGDPVIDAAPAQRLGEFARAVGGQDDDRRLAGAGSCRARGCVIWKSDRNSSRNASNSWSERSISSTSSTRRSGARSDLQQRPRDQETVVIDVDLVLAGLADREQLALVVPFVERVRGVDALVALQPDQIAAEQLARAPWRPPSCRRPARLRAAAACRAGWPGRWPSPGPHRRDSATLQGAAPPPPARSRRLGADLGMSCAQFAALRALQRAQDALRRDRQRVDAHADRVEDGVGDRRDRRVGASSRRRPWRRRGRRPPGRSSTTISISARSPGPGIRYSLKSAAPWSRSG